jgi:hypothetical protein
MQNIFFFFSIYDNDINYDQFRTTSFMTAFDLTASGNASLPFIVPSVRTGNSKIVGTFSAPCSVALRLFYHCQFSSTLQIAPNGDVSLSYM